jgi:serine/threonine protein kinase
MGEVYRAHDEALGRDVAIKILRAASGDPDLNARFQREARALAALSHPNIVTIYELAAADGLDYAVTELLAGRTLRDALDDGPLPEDKALGIAGQVLSALAEAHAKGIVHRDLKPENLFLTTRGETKILDFGLAAVRPSPAGSSISDVETRLTAPGKMVGTSGYMSPEQVLGLEVDPRTDVFSFGIVLYEMLVGRHPFERPTAVGTLTAILRDPPPPAEGLHAGLERLLARCLAKDAGERWADAGALEAALRAVRKRPRPASTRRRRLPGA